MTITIQRAPHVGGVLATAIVGCSTTTSIIIERQCLAAAVALPPAIFQAPRGNGLRPACVPFDDRRMRGQSRTPLRRGCFVLATC